MKKTGMITLLAIGAITSGTFADGSDFWDDAIGFTAYNVKINIGGVKASKKLSGKFIENGEVSPTHKFSKMNQSIKGILIDSPDLDDPQFFEFVDGGYYEWDEDDVEICVMRYFDNVVMENGTNVLATVAGSGLASINLMFASDVYDETGTNWLAECKVKAALRGKYTATSEEVVMGSETNEVYADKGVFVGKGRGVLCDGDGYSEDGEHGPITEDFLFPNQKFVVNGIVLKSNTKLSAAMTDAFVGGLSTNDNYSAACDAADVVFSDYMTAKTGEAADDVLYWD